MHKKMQDVQTAVAHLTNMLLCTECDRRLLRAPCAS